MRRHLMAAAREMVLAARSLIDAAIAGVERGPERPGRREARRIPVR